MSIQIVINESTRPILARESVAHYLPCRVGHDGPANVQRFFAVEKSEHDADALTSSFRGRPLNGQPITLPKGYKCVVLHEEARRPLGESQRARRVHVTHVFSRFTYWNLDKAPSRNDPFLAALDWLDIAEAIHS